jgi:hypothetical protein
MPSMTSSFDLCEPLPFLADAVEKGLAIFGEQ